MSLANRLWGARRIHGGLLKLGIVVDQIDEHFRVEGRRTWFETVEQMQEALDAYLVTYKRASQHPSVYVAEGNRLS
ncbi:MAG: hypothetical protein PSV46_01465 [Reyranella sp.]|nr:hypothetical protein [Reyranella sp.]